MGRGERLDGRFKVRYRLNIDVHGRYRRGNRYHGTVPACALACVGTHSSAMNIIIIIAAKHPSLVATARISQSVPFSEGHTSIDISILVLPTMGRSSAFIGRVNTLILRWFSRPASEAKPTAF